MTYMMYDTKELVKFLKEHKGHSGVYYGLNFLECASCRVHKSVVKGKVLVDQSYRFTNKEEKKARRAWIKTKDQSLLKSQS